MASDADWAEQTIGALVEESLPHAVYLVDPRDGAIIWANRAFAQMYGYSSDELRNLTVFDLHFPEGLEEARSVLDEILRERAASTEFWTRTKAGRAIHVRIEARLVRRGDQALVLSMAWNLTSEETAELQAAIRESRRESMVQRLTAINAMLRAVSFAVDIDWMVQRMSETVEALIPHDRLSITLVSLVGDVSVVYGVAGEASALGKGTVLPLRGSDAGEVLATDAPIIRFDLRQEPPFIEREPLLTMGIHSFISVPLHSQGRSMGALNVGSFEPNAYGPSDIAVAAEIADQIGELVERSRYIADTLEVARAGLDHASTVAARNTVALSPREREILVLLASGAHNADIASRLSLTINSIKFHVANIFSKLGVHSRTEAAVFAVKSRLSPTDTPDAPLSL